MEHSQPYQKSPKREIAAPQNGGPSPSRYEQRDFLEANLSGESPSGLLLEYWYILRRRKGRLLIAAFLGLLGGILFTLPQTPIYQARTSLEIQGLNENFLNMKEGNLATTVPDYSLDFYIQTQMKILQSETLIERVVAKLTQKNRAQPLAVPDRLSAWRNALGLTKPANVDAGHAAVLAAASNLAVRTSGMARIVEVLCDSTNPRLAADFVNTLATEYIDQNLEARWKTSQHTGEWLTRQLEDLKIKLEKSEDDLQVYARSAGLMFTAEKESMAEEKLRQLQQALSNAQADRVAKQSQYQIMLTSPPDSLPEVLDDASLRENQAKLTDLRRQLAELSSSYTPVHYKVQRVQAQIAELESALQKDRANILKRIFNDFQAAQNREKLLSAQHAGQAKLVSEQATRAIHYNILKREVDTNRALYDGMLQKVKESSITAAMRASNIRVVDAAKIPSSPYKPKLAVNLGLGLLTGLGLGIALVIAGERANRAIQGPGDSPFYLNVPELGVIPSAKADPGKQVYGKRQRLSFSAAAPHDTGENTPKENGQAASPVELVTFQRKPSLLAESFRATLASILFMGQNGKSSRVIVLTSPNPSEGKTTIVSNLGVAMAETHRRVLVIDADLRKPRLHKIFDLENTRGLSNLLQERNSSDDLSDQPLAYDTGIPGLYVLPSGPAAGSISNLLYSARMPELIARFRQEFDAVLIDTPPMLQMSDARVLGRLADGVILVIRSGQTTRDIALSATQRFEEDGTPLLGTILNDWNPKTAGSYGYDGFYDSYYHYYGKRK